MTFWKKEDVYSAGFLPMPLGVAVEGRAVRHHLIHASRLVREVVLRLMCSRVKILPTVGIQTAHFEGSTKRHTGVLTCNQHKVDVTAG